MLLLLVHGQWTGKSGLNVRCWTVYFFLIFKRRSIKSEMIQLHHKEMVVSRIVQNKLVSKYIDRCLKKRLYLVISKTTARILRPSVFLMKTSNSWFLI